MNEFVKVDPVKVNCNCNCNFDVIEGLLAEILVEITKTNKLLKEIKARQ